MQTFCPLLIGPKESEASRCGAAINSWMSETWGADVLFSFCWTPVRRHYREGMSKTGRKESIHQAGPWALFREGVDAAGPHAGSGRCRRLMRRRAPLFKSLLQHHPAMDSEGVQPLPAGQKFSGPEAGASETRLASRRVFTWISEDGSASAFWGGFCPHPTPPFKWLPCQPSAVQNFHATSNVDFEMCWFGCCGFFLCGL